MDPDCYRDLPLLFNQWANVVRWEIRPRLFLRMSEFLWQEGHTAYATEADQGVQVARSSTRSTRPHGEACSPSRYTPAAKTDQERFAGATFTDTSKP